MNFETAQQIRKAYVGGGVTQAELSRRFHTTRHVVGRIINNQIWLDESEKNKRYIGACEADRDKLTVETGFSKDADKWGALLYG